MSQSNTQHAGFDHPTIGYVRGRATGDVVQFLGIKYASLRHWFDNPTLCTCDGSGIVADHHGYVFRCQGEPMYRFTEY